MGDTMAMPPVHTAENPVPRPLEAVAHHPNERRDMTAERRQAAAPGQGQGSANDLTVIQSGTDRTPPPAPPDAAPIPPAAFGRYEVRRALGAGGFGAVYLAHDTQLDRPVAIKVLRAAVGQLQAMAS